MGKFYPVEDYPIIETDKGKVRGYTRDGVLTFHGIKYADAKRFQMPEPVQPWEGVKDALDYGFICPNGDAGPARGELLNPHRFWPSNEHCQYLNVWSTGTETRKPVLVWMHGGGFSGGSSIEMTTYEGYNLSKFGDVVFVSVNHRLNILGFLDVSAYGEKYWNSGNVGQADLVAALQWVHDNIAAFGGDPDNVTIVGQSGGGMKVSALCVTPSAKGLFQKAIIMSGANIAMGGPRDDKPIVDSMLTELGLTSDDMDKFETVPYNELLAAYRNSMKKLREQGVKVGMSGPLPNSWFPGDPLEVGFSQQAFDIPVMIGTAFAEFSMGKSFDDKDSYTAEQRRELLSEVYGDKTDEIIALFKAAYPNKNELDVTQLDNRMFRQDTIKHANMRSEQGVVYNYIFAPDFIYAGQKKTAWHCADIHYAFHNLEMSYLPCAQEGLAEKLEDQLSNAFIAFARTGNPNCDAVPDWKPYTPDCHATMIFDENTELRVNHDATLIDELVKFSKPFIPGM